MDKAFCITPFIGLQILDEGNVRFCCKATETIYDDNGIMNLYHHSVGDIWNSDYMRNIRRNLANGQRIPQCRNCYQDEKNGGSSTRINDTNKWLEILDTSIDEVKQEAEKTDFAIPEMPKAYHINLSNICNLKCRMCNSYNSSLIRGDDVHSKWTPIPHNIQSAEILWERNSAVIGPVSKLGVMYKGMSSYEKRSRSRQFESETASINVKFREPQPDLQKLSMTIGLEPKILSARTSISFIKSFVKRILARKLPAMLNRDVSVKINGNENKCKIKLGKTFQVELVNLGETGDLNIEIFSKGLPGLQLQEIGLSRKRKLRGGRIESSNPRFGNYEHWSMQDEVVFGELFDKEIDVKEIYFTGGEPLVHDQMYRIMDFLIDKGVSNEIQLRYNTNCTKVPDKFLSQLKEFKRIIIGLSLDGVEDTYEYIRYPAKWSKVEENVRKLAAAPEVNMSALPVFGAYNVMNVVDFCRKMDSMGIKFILYPLYHPIHISLRILPKEAREQITDMLQEYLDNECREVNRPYVARFIKHLNSMDSRFDSSTIDMFMRFTNDLDKSRNQSIRAINPWLVNLLEQRGYRWDDRTLHYSTEALKGSE